MDADDRAAILRAYVGNRTNRRHKPGRALERTGYRFDVLADYGATVVKVGPTPKDGAVQIRGVPQMKKSLSEIARVSAALRMNDPSRSSTKPAFFTSASRTICGDFL